MILENETLMIHYLIQHRFRNQRQKIQKINANFLILLFLGDLNFFEEDDWEREFLVILGNKMNLN